MRRKAKRPLFAAFLNFARYAAVILLAYLLQVCLMPEVRIFGVTPSLIFAVTGVITVCFERLKTFWAGLIFGILLEVMQPTQQLFNLLLYPVAAILGMLFFADKSAQRLEYERGLGKPGRNTVFWVRIPLCAFVDEGVYQLVNLTYVYLRGGELSGPALLRGLAGMLLTAALAAVLMFPLRRFFGIRTAPDLTPELRPTPYRT